MAFFPLILGDQMLVVDENQHNLSDHHHDSAIEHKIFIKMGAIRELKTEQKQGNQICFLFSFFGEKRKPVFLENFLKKKSGYCFLNKFR